MLVCHSYGSNPDRKCTANALTTTSGTRLLVVAMPRLASFGSPLETVGTWKEPCRKRHHTTSQWLRQQRRTGLCLLSCRRSKPASRLFFHVILAIRFAKILNEDPQVVTLLPDAIKCTRFLPEWVEEKIKGQPMFWVGFL